MMGNEKRRLIDANTMREDWLVNGENEYVYDTNAVLDSIDAQPTVDAVEVVRCKDCVHRKERVCMMPYAGMWVGVELKDDDFCSYGERKDND